MFPLVSDYITTITGPHRFDSTSCLLY